MRSSKRSAPALIGWIAGLVNAFPAESVALYRYAVEGCRDEAFAKRPVLACSMPIGRPV